MLAGEELRRDPLALLPAGEAVYQRRMYVQDQTEREQIVKRRFNARALFLKAGKARGHHVRKRSRFPLFIAGRVIRRHHGGELCTVHTDESVFRNGSKRRPRAFDIHFPLVFQRSISPACKNVIFVFAVIIRKFYQFRKIQFRYLFS